jgi:hypothetical protein
VRAKLDAGRPLKRALAILLAGITLAGAVFLGSAHLKMHGHFHCTTIPGNPGQCYAPSSYWVVGRYEWQIPVAIVVAAVGLGGAVALAKRR